MPRRMTYAKAGVDIDRKSDSIAALVRHLEFKRSGIGKPIDMEGHFTGLIDLGELALTLCTDGVGTKLLVADAMGKWDTVGIDCIAMNVNDTICVGAEPVAFVDYIAIDKPDTRVTAAVGKGLDDGARESNMTIVGGEIAVLPELVKGLDLSGTCLGIVEKSRIVSGREVSADDIVIGLPSSGIHSNGLTLARKVFESNGIGYRERVKGLRRSVGMELLEPTSIYVRKVINLLQKVDVHGMANITGGGLRNLLRLKKGVGFVIDDPMRPQPIFPVMQELGAITDEEMYQTFNMGMGFCLLVSERDSSAALELLGKDAKVVGQASGREGVELPELGLRYTKY